MGVLRSMVLAFIAIGFLVLYTQIRFKPQMRTIVLDKEGLKTTIGKKSGSRSWKELKSVEEQSDDLIITGKNGNAFIIPPRAFSSAENRAAFLSFALSSITA